MRGKSVLVGRNRELAELASALDQAAAGSGGVVVLAGEPGIGKTRLMQAAAHEAERRGFAVAWGRAWELGGAPVFWPWVEALRELGQKTAERSLPQLGRQTETERFLLFDEVTAFLRGVSAERPVLLLLDDLHAADPSTLLLTEFVARQLDATHTLVIASHREVEARGTQEVWASLMRLSRVARVLRLPRLEHDDVAALVRELLGTENRETADMVNNTSGGNPLFVRELVQLIAARSRTEGRLDVPEGVRAVIRQRLALLSPAAVALLSAAAIVGREFAVAIVAEISGIAVTRLVETLQEAESAEIIEQAGSGRYRFSHVLVADLLAHDLPVEIRCKHHRQTAETLERLHASDPDAPIDEIAQHFLAAGSDAAGLACRAATRAAERAMQQLAFEDAALWFERALAALAVATPGDAATRTGLLLAAGEAHFRGGAREPGTVACLKASDLARDLGSGDLLARAALALGGEVATGINDHRLIALLKEALAVLPSAPGAWRARVIARLAGALQPALDPRVPTGLAREAIAMARDLGDRAVLVNVLHAANAALLDYAPIDEQVALNAEVIALATERAERPLALRANLRLAFAHLQNADLEGFNAAVDGYERLAKEFRQPRYHWQTLMLRSMQPLWEGRFEDSDRMEAEARTLIERAGDDNGDRALLMRRAIALSTRAAIEDAYRAFDRLSELAPSGSMRRLLMAFPRARQGDVAIALEANAGIDDELFPKILLDPNFRAAMVDLIVLAKDRPRMAALYEVLLPSAGHVIPATGLGFAIQEFVDRLLCVLAASLGRTDDADRHATEGLALMARFGARPFAAQLKTDWAEDLLRRGDGTRGRALAAEALASAQELSMSGLVLRLRRLIDAAPAPTAAPAEAPAQGPQDIAARLEGEFWTVTGCGQLCRLKDARGLRMLAQLLADPGREIHVLDLVGADQVDLGDAGEVIDAQARETYRLRIGELREELAEAQAWNDLARQTRLKQEVEAISDQLNAGVGLGNRNRRTGSAVERARVNVQRRLSDALKRIEQSAPALGRTLAATVRTGTFCVYRPIA